MHLGYDPQIENGWVRIQRVAWGVMAVLVLGGIAGIFGRGPLSTAQASTADGAVTVRYERFARFRTPSQSVITVTQPQTAALRVHVAGAWLAALPAQSLDPRPAEEIPVAGGTDFVFAAEAGSGPVRITLTQQAAKAGLVRGEITVQGERPVAVTQFVWP